MRQTLINTLKDCKAFTLSFCKTIQGDVNVFFDSPLETQLGHYLKYFYTNNILICCNGKCWAVYVSNKGELIELSSNNTTDIINGYFQGIITAIKYYNNPPF